MVWEVVTPAVLLSDTKNLSVQEQESQTEHTGMMMDADRDQSHELHCCEHFPTSPSFPTCDSYMEYDDLPDLQEVQEPAAPPIYQVEIGVSHQEACTFAETHSPQPPDTQWLTQLAHIATGPQSPLLQESSHSSSSLVYISSSRGDLHSYARPPPIIPPPPLHPKGTSSPPQGHDRKRRHSRTSSECGSAVSTRSSLSDDEDMGWSFSWPPTVWHCFLKGSHMRFHSGYNTEWQDAEELGSAEEDSYDEEQSRSVKNYGSEGLKLVEHSEVVLSGQAVLQLTFDPGTFGHTPMTARCPLDHPFYVKNKGWSSFYPSLTVVHYGIPCYELEVGDVCLPPGHRDAKHTDVSLVFDAFRSYDFTPLDSSAVYVLSSMARRRRASQSSRGAASPERDKLQGAKQKPNKSQCVGAQGGSKTITAGKCKRPMNAFMLFAKKFRVEYTQRYPGKDNRAISVLLGEHWKKLRNEERRVFTLQAKALADEQKRLNPDCWKRKRTNSGCQGN